MALYAAFVAFPLRLGATPNAMAKFLNFIR